MLCTFSLFITGRKLLSLAKCHILIYANGVPATNVLSLCQSDRILDQFFILKSPMSLCLLCNMSWAPTTGTHGLDAVYNYCTLGSFKS